MRKCEMTTAQLKDLEYFHLILEAYGWEDLEDSEQRLNAGELMKPEAIRSQWMGSHCLTARYHAPVNMISLEISDWQEEEKVQAHFLYDNRPERILEWMVQTSEQLELARFEEQITEAQAHCEMILFEKSDMEIYEVKPETRS